MNDVVERSAPAHATDADPEERFAFGENWQHFIEHVDDARIQSSIDGLSRMLGTKQLQGKRLLDLGCGSGLSSLAARRLGATVVGVDFDPQSLAAAKALRARFAPADTEENWQITGGSALDPAFMRSLGSFDVIYSWGVLHHTGHLWDAMELAAEAVAPGGQFAVAIYNDQGAWSQRWMRIKRLYNRLPRFLRPLYVAVVSAPGDLRMILSSLVRLRPLEYPRIWINYRKDRGMSRWHDLVDWVGGYPFEVARPEEVLEFARKRDFELIQMHTVRGACGCNEFLLAKSTSPHPKL